MVRCRGWGGRSGAVVGAEGQVPWMVRIKKKGTHFCAPHVYSVLLLTRHFSLDFSLVTSHFSLDFSLLT